ncbi:MAG TPA: redoxin domain-containing protein, partial [Candidatus Eisenbacteria bacterium]
MRFRAPLLAAALLAAASSACLSDPIFHSGRTADDFTRLNERTWLNAAEPPVSIVVPGDPAPDFSYQADTGEWLKFHQLLDHGCVMLVFAPNESDLEQIESERDSLYGAGVIPVAVLDRSRRASSALAARLGLGFPVIADPQDAIASLFNLVGPPTARTHPGWFVVDRTGRVRALERGRVPRGG